MPKILSFAGTAAFVFCGQADTSAADLTRCAAAGAAQPLAAITKQIRKATRVRVNRAGLDPVEKEAYILDDCARAALMASDQVRIHGSHQQTRLPEPRSKRLLIGIRTTVQVTIYENSLAKWMAPGLAVRLDATGKAFQPVGEAVTPTYVAAFGPISTYSRVSWLEFETPPDGQFELVLTSSDGKTKKIKVDLNRVKWLPDARPPA